MGDMTLDRNKEEGILKNGPLSLLVTLVQSCSQVLISCKNNRKILGRIKAFDRHLNMILENVKEIWTEDKTSDENKIVKLHERFFSKLFLRGDQVVVVLKTIT